MNSLFRNTAHFSAFKPVIKDFRSFFWIFVFHFAAAFLEGVSFVFIFRGLDQIQTPLVFGAYILFAIGSQVARSLSNYFAANGTMSLSSKWQTYFQERIFAQILKMNFSCVNRYKTGDLVEYTRLPSTAIYALLDHGNKFFVALFGVFALLVTMCFLSLKLTLLALLVFGVLGLLQRWIVRKISDFSKKYHTISSDFSRETVQTLQGLRAIFTFHRGEEMLEVVKRILQKMGTSLKKMAFWNNVIAPINEISGVLLVGVFLIIGLSGNGAGVPSALMTFVLMIYRLNGRVQGLFSSASGVAHQWGQLTAIQDILEDEDKEFTQTEGLPLPQTFHSIQLNNITLRYPGKTTDALKDITLSIPKGKMIGIVGPSGAGKSSLLDLLLRLYEPTSGQILIDGVPLQTYEPASWRKRLGVVSQEIFLFHATIEENIRFGSSHASQSQIESAAKMAGVAEFIEKLPSAYQTIVGERGHRLSGGEKQRIALARALLRDPDILILDEATSHLDSHSEAMIKSALEKLKGQKTLIIVAHRLSTIADADSIVVLDHGQIKEQGSHEELHVQNELYRSLWQMQLMD